MNFQKLVLRTETSVKFIPENEDDNVEYKLRLDLKPIFHLEEKMISQMKWRLSNEINSRNICVAHYIIGIRDDGTLGELPEDIITINLELMKRLVLKCGAQITYCDKVKFHNSWIIMMTISKEFEHATTWNWCDEMM